MSAAGPLERSARNSARYYLLQGIVAAGDALPPLIAEAEQLAAGLASTGARQPADARAAVAVLRHAFETGRLPETLS